KGPSLPGSILREARDSGITCMCFNSFFARTYNASPLAAQHEITGPTQSHFRTLRGRAPIAVKAFCQTTANALRNLLQSFSCSQRPSPGIIITTIMPMCDGRCSDLHSHRIGKDARRESGGLFICTCD